MYLSQLFKLFLFKSQIPERMPRRRHITPRFAAAWSKTLTIILVVWVAVAIAAIAAAAGWMLWQSQKW